jgi:large subunit ribosomal protein L1
MASAHYMGGQKKKMELKTDLKKALEELRKEKERKFDQTLDLIVNLQKFNLKKDSINLIVNVPHKIKEKKVAAFLESKSKFIDTITPEEFKKYSNKTRAKKLVKSYDFFMAQASLMPKVATNFGRALGPTGKMPNPQLGIMLNADEKSIQEIKEKINNSIKIKTIEPSIKVAVGRQSQKDEELLENILAVYSSITKALPRDTDNIKNLEIKFTMTKPVKIKIR